MISAQVEIEVGYDEPTEISVLDLEAYRAGDDGALEKLAAE